MPELRLKFNGVEIAPKDGVTTLGRTPDNDVAFPDDSNVSRSHAEIEARGDEFCLIDLNSSNGTTVNGDKVVNEKYLKAGDLIMLGGSSEVIFDYESVEPELPADVAVDTTAAAAPDLPPVGDALRQTPSLAASTAAPAEGSRTMLMVAAGAVLVAVVVVGVTGAIYYHRRSSACEAKARITKPEAGETLYAATEVEVAIDDPGCVAKVIYTIDGAELESADEPPFTIILDPKVHPDLADGFDHSLGVVLVDDDGNQIRQTGNVLLAMETRKVDKPEDKPVDRDLQDPTPRITEKNKEVPIIEVQEMTARLVKQFSGDRKYNVSNKQFLQEVQKKAAEYSQEEGYFERASRYRDVINVAFVREQNLDASLGYVLAMSRSRFDLQKGGPGEGLWRMDPAFVKENAYDGVCGGQPISEASQNCAAKAAATYMKAMVYGVFDGDVLYSAVAFGKSTTEATAWKSTLPANRVDVWNTIRTAPEREQLVRFFAAGIVADNPQKFGLKRDPAISTLYP